MPLSRPKFDVISNDRNSICVVIRIHLNLCSYDGAHEILNIFCQSFAPFMFSCLKSCICTLIHLWMFFFFPLLAFVLFNRISSRHKVLDNGVKSLLGLENFSLARHMRNKLDDRRSFGLLVICNANK